ncbi:hypothetical protein [Catenulispora pinisilvae]|uniref:hypothetical protein n=1 Tax=Catenulispora pinisilvae TaxID=2705253 RepID=UPI0018917F52|nr:hypothetical protein [Catenulispora pinisilvae]
MKPSQVERVRKYLTSAGVEGEEVLAVATAYPAGRVSTLTKGMKSEVTGLAVGGGVGALAGKKAGRDRQKQRVDAALDRSAGPDLPVRERNVLALTTGRLLVFSLGGLITSQPRKLQWDLPLAEIAWAAKGELTTGMAMALRVDVGLADGRVARLEFPRAAVKDGTALIDELIRRLPEPPAEPSS